MTDTDISDAPSLAPPIGADKFRDEQRAFYRLLPQLLVTHRGLFVAIHEGRVVGTGPDAVTVATAAYAEHGYLSVYANCVSETPPAAARLGIYRESPVRH